MALLSFSQYLLSNAPVVILVLLFVAAIRNRFKSGIRSVPGPFLAKFSDLWRFHDVWKGRPDETHIQLHRKYGDYVRLGPNAVSISNLATIKNIYGINSGYNKSDFYVVQQQMKAGKPVQTLFTTIDENFHAAIKRPISNAYSMSTLTEFEPFVDRTIVTFFNQLTEKYIQGGNAGKLCDMGEWLQFYAFDVIGEITFSRRLGFLDQGTDINGIIADLESIMSYNGKIGQIPALDYLFKKNPILSALFKPTGKVAEFSQQRLTERLREPKSADAPARDFLDRFIEARKLYPKVVTEAQILSYTITNIFAGSDTTAISLRAILYYTLKNPDVLRKLQAELRTAVENGKLSSPASWKQSQELPYLDAVVKEALRLHPAVGLPLERIVPSSGLKLENGVLLPPGTIVGCSPWVVHRDAAVFGDKPDSFIPERWLQAGSESEQSWKARRLEMTRSTFTFGAGPRTCIGKNISLLEIYKLIPSLFVKFKVELAFPERDWSVVNSWFVGQKGISVKLSLLD